MSALLEPGAENLIVLRDERSFWFKREFTGLDKVPCHFGRHEGKLVEQGNEAEGVLNSELLRNFIKVFFFHAVLVDIVRLAIDWANDHTESPALTRVTLWVVLSGRSTVTIASTTSSS